MLFGTCEMEKYQSMNPEFTGKRRRQSQNEHLDAEKVSGHYIGMRLLNIFFFILK